MKPQIRVALPISLSFALLLVVLALSIRGAKPVPAPNPGSASALSPSSNGAISPQDQADALHFIIAADREIFFREYFAQRTGGPSSPDASGGGKPGESPLSPCEMIRRAAESIQIKGAEFSFALRSIRPIDPRNGPQTELEQRGLALVTSHPTQSYYGQEVLGGRPYFTAVYPDSQATTTCIDCHSKRSASIPQHYQVGDAMGGIVVRIPLEF